MKGENLMADEFEPETGISEAELEKIYSSKYLGADDVGDRKIRTKILHVGADDLRQQDGRTRRKAILFCEGLDKQVVLNVTNYNILKTAFSTNPSKWVGRTIGIKTVPRTVGGKATRGIEIVILGADTFKVSMKPMPTKKPKPAPKTEPEFPEEDDDPGFEPDPSRDFEEAAE
jgi:hypothetical protein